MKLIRKRAMSEIAKQSSRENLKKARAAQMLKNGDLCGRRNNVVAARLQKLHEPPLQMSVDKFWKCEAFREAVNDFELC